MAPAVMMARSAIAHSGRFSLTSATRSPGSIPSEARDRATALTASATWPKLSAA